MKRHIQHEVIEGDALDVLQSFPQGTFDICLTSPPYWKHRLYANSGIGQEGNAKAYIEHLCAILDEVKRVLKPKGSMWLNIGDTYDGKSLQGIPWRVALELVDRRGWFLRNDVIWNKVKGSPDNSRDKLRNIHEHVFHFVKNKNYYYDCDAIRSTARHATVRNGAVISATGVSGIRYKRQIELSTILSHTQKVSAVAALNDVIQQVQEKKISDFRMIIKGQQRVTHSDDVKVSGRAKQLQADGYYFLKYHPNGSKPADVWDILPEDSQGRTSHFAPFPHDLCRIPILSTCPLNGIVLDPFCGTGTSLIVAKQLGRKALGIEISPVYAANASQRLARTGVPLL